jgi:cell wall-associated NlpC family hydrolase
LTKPLISLALAGTLAVAGNAPALYASGPGAPSPSSARLVSARIVSVALAYVGYRYAYIGDTPATGFSCTGFVHWVYSQFGYDTPEDPAVLYYSYPHIAPAAMQPGDVLIFANTVYAGFSHAAIYIGGGQMVGADNFSVGVHVDNVYDGYWGPRFVGAIRIAPYAAPTQQVAGATSRRPAAHRSSPRPRERHPFWHPIRRH